MMDNQRLFVWALFGLMLFITWQAWLQDYAPRPQPPAPAATTPAAEPLTEPGAEDLPSLADLPAAEPAEPAASELPPAEAQAAAGPSAGSAVRVRTDVLELAISLRGGDLVEATTLKYPVEKGREDLMRLLGASRETLAVFQSGLRAGDGGPEPNHLAEYTAAADRYLLAGGEDELEVPLTWRGENGIAVTKTYRFSRGSYIVPVTYTVLNQGDAPWRAASYVQLVKRDQRKDRSMFDVETYSFDGPVLYDGERYRKLDRDDLEDDGPVTATAAGGWFAAIQHHFLEAAVPPPDEPYRYEIALRGANFLQRMIGPPKTLAPGESAVYEATLFVGPKLQEQLEEVSPKLKLTVDYGFLTILADPLFWLLEKVHDVVGNWGWAIIIVTFLIKLVFYKLTETSGRSMARMRRIQPRMKALQERYKDDRQKLSQKMMELYKREKVNPAAGCLPILIQMPFFFAFYWVLLESVEMRQAPFMLWIDDLSARDPYFVLPLLMGAAMLVQQQLNPAPADPVQAKVMRILPIVFTVFFAFFPAGLVLYWLTNTLLSVAQQWRINKVVAVEEKKARK